MKQLIVIRHAKSSWDDPSLDDFDRPLNARGKRDAPEMGRRLKAAGVMPDRMVASPAKRAYATAKKIAKELGYKKAAIQTQQRLYHAEAEEILAVVRELDDNDEIVFVFGHNPGLTDFVNMVGNGVDIENIPTCGVVVFKCNVKSWIELQPGACELLNFDFPKRDK